MPGPYDDRYPRYTPPVDPGAPAISNGFGLLSGLFQQPAAAPLPTPALNPQGKDKPGFKWTPEAVMRAQEELAKAYQGKGIAPMYGGTKASGALGLAANVINPFMGTYQMKQQMDAAAENERMRSEAVKGAFASGADARKVLASSGVPDLQSAVLPGYLEENSEKGQLNLRILRAQAAQAEQKDALEQFLLNEAGGPARTPGAPAAAPVGTPTPAPASPPAGNPGVSVAPQSAPAATASAAPAAPQTARELLTSRTPAERLAFLMAYKKDPGEAAKMLREWADPNKKQEDARQTEFGQSQAKAQAALPNAMSTTDRLLQQIDNVLYESDPKNPGKYLADPKNPGQYMPNKTLPGVTGRFQGSPWVPTLSGTKRAMEEKLKQIQGGVFLEAFQALKGGGAISDAEGKPATAAIARLSALDQDDKEYRNAIIDARNEIMRVRQLAQDRAAGKIPMPSETTAAPSQPQASPRAAATSHAFIQEAAAAGIPPAVASQVPEGKRIKNPKTGQSFLKINGRLVDENAGNAAAAAEAQAQYAPTLPNPLSNFDPSGQFTGRR